MAIPTQTGNAGNGGSNEPSTSDTPTQGTTKVDANEMIVHFEGGNHGRIVLASGNAVTLPLRTADADMLKELAEFEKHHPALVIEKFTVYEKRLVDAAKAAAETGGL